MKLPVAPPPTGPAEFAAMLANKDSLNRWLRLTDATLGPAPGGKYRHWDTFRHKPPLEGFPPDEQWMVVKIARRSLYRDLPLQDAKGVAFKYALPNVALEMLHQVERKGAGNLQINEQVTNPATRDTYLFKSIVEEAITSSQLEGASTTRKVAKAMIQEGRPPRTRSERMIVNNYEAMRQVLSMKDEPLTPALVMRLQRTLTEGTLDEPDAAGRFRRADEGIAIEDETGTRLHTPPPSDQLEGRMSRMCDFANAVGGGEFMPPAVRAILLHFWLAYDHPFVDGNGRTARVLLYWSMAHQGYWLCEYLSISRILKKARGQYARSYLYTESDENDVTYFLLYQLRVLLRAIDELYEFLARKAAEMHAAEEMVRRATRIRGEFNHRQLAIIQHATKNPDARYSLSSHRRSHGVSYQTARTDLLKLVAEHLLEQIKLGRAFAFFPSKDLHSRLEARSKR